VLTTIVIHDALPLAPPFALQAQTYFLTNHYGLDGLQRAKDLSPSGLHTM
jgi:hypothetical protein